MPTPSYSDTTQKSWTVLVWKMYCFQPNQGLRGNPFLSSLPVISPHFLSPISTDNLSYWFPKALSGLERQYSSRAFASYCVIREPISEVFGKYCNWKYKEISCCCWSFSLIWDQCFSLDNISKIVVLSLALNQNTYIHMNTYIYTSHYIKTNASFRSCRKIYNDHFTPLSVVDITPCVIFSKTLYILKNRNSFFIKSKYLLCLSLWYPPFCFLFLFF